MFQRFLVSRMYTLASPRMFIKNTHARVSLPSQNLCILPKLPKWVRCTSMLEYLSIKNSALGFLIWKTGDPGLFSRSQKSLWKDPAQCPSGVLRNCRLPCPSNWGVPGGLWVSRVYTWPHFARDPEHCFLGFGVQFPDCLLLFLIEFRRRPWVGQTSVINLLGFLQERFPKFTIFYISCFSFQLRPSQENILLELK